ncbi:hypothetical protein MGN70_001708 [Eutypa lata]|nr:hypothetical protein MGN70_001708 [Eutypa lata]
MTLALLLLLETLTLAASAARLDFPPAATPTVEDGANAVLLRPSPTPTARFATAELLHGRDYTMGQDTCGFGSAQPGITYECYLEEATCTNIGEYRGCCTSGLSSCSSTMWTTCEDYQSISVCGSDYHTRCCQSAVPYCVTWQLEGTDGTTYTAFDCDLDNTMRVREMLSTPLSLISTTESASGASSSVSSSSPSGSSSGSSSGAVPSSTASTTTSSATHDGSATTSASNSDSSNDSSSSDSSNGSSAPAGAIAGGVVGGLVVVGLTVFGLVFFRRRNRRAAADREKLSTSPPPPPMGPQEIASSDTTSPLEAAPYSPDGYANINGDLGGRQDGEAFHYDPKTGGYIFEAPDTSFVPEAPNTPARGQEGNRAELN